MSNKPPKPDVEVSLCIKCDKMTDNWYTYWPENSEIIWMCRECQEKLAKKSREKLEQRLENMCKEKDN
jgi:hypothetical protein